MVPIVVGNWKMNTTLSEALELVSSMRERLDSLQGVEKVICPPFISLATLSVTLRETSIKLGAQNMHYEPNGAFTGEVASTMISDLCQYVILGHSERRQHFGETNQLIRMKILSALKAGLRPILCVGETLKQRQEGKEEQIISEQLRKCLKNMEHLNNIIVAYEPVWAIGTGEAADPTTVSEMMEGVIFKTLATLQGEHIARNIPLLYGGSITQDNVEDFLIKPNIHGGLIGGSSLKADQFIEIARITAKIKEHM